MLYFIASIDQVPKVIHEEKKALSEFLSLGVVRIRFICAVLEYQFRLRQISAKSGMFSQEDKPGQR